MSIDPKTTDAPMRKFMFDRSFDQAALAQRAVERKPVLLKPEQFDALKKESYDAGFAAGKDAGKEEQTSLLASIMTAVGNNVEALMKNIAALSQAQDTHTRQLVVAIAKKIVPDFVARNGAQEIESLLSHAIRDMAREPRLVVRVNETQVAAISERIQTITAQQAYAGQVIIIADAETAPGDCRIEWAQGGIERNTQATWNAIEETIGVDVTPLSV